FLNSYSMYATLQEPKDWLAIATKCSVNPKHEHYGKEPEDILTIWNTKKEYKAAEGNNLDDYITLKLGEKDLARLLMFRQQCIDTKQLSLLQKTEQFDNLYDDLLHKLNYVNSEIWL